jgi:hypothetical protein
MANTDLSKMPRERLASIYENVTLRSRDYEEHLTSEARRVVFDKNKAATGFLVEAFPWPACGNPEAQGGTSECRPATIAENGGPALA